MVTPKLRPGSTAYLSPAAIALTPHNLEASIDELEFSKQIDSAGFRSVVPTIRSTAMETWAQCHRKYMFRYRLGLKSKAAVYVPSLEIGRMFHLVMAELLKGATPERAAETGAHAVETFKADLLALADEAGTLPNGKLLTSVIAQAESDFVMARAMALSMWSMVPLDTSRFRVLETEKLHTVRYAGLVPIRGRIDLLVEDTRDNALWIWDHKSTSKSPTARAATASIEFQPKLYRLLVQAAYPSRTVEGVVHNIVQKPTIRYCKKDADFPAYVARCVEWYKERFEQNPTDPPAVRSFVRFPHALLSAEFLTQLSEISRASRATVSPSKFYRDPTCHACFGMFGNHRCPYWDLCTTSQAAWPSIFSTAFTQSFRDEEDEQSEETNNDD